MMTKTEWADITVVTPTIPTEARQRMLKRAVDSVQSQRLKPVTHCIITDTAREGSAAVRNRGLQMVTTEWTAFLDDDDEFLPHHLRVLHGWAERENVDVVYPSCRLVDGLGRESPVTPDWAGRPGKPFDPDLLRERSYIPVTSLVRTELAQQVGGFVCPEGSQYDDWGMYLRLLDVGARFLHVPVVTWKWHVHGANTSGQADRW